VFMDTIKGTRYAEIDEWETEMLVKAMRVARILLYSPGIPEAEKALTGVNVIRDVREAVEHSLEHFHEKRLAVIPEGPYVIPSYAGSSSHGSQGGNHGICYRAIH